MTISNSFFAAATRLTPFLTALLLAGCQTPRPPIVGVISPDSPVFGSAPIAAYDEYAWAIKPRVGTPRSENVILISSR